MAKEYGCCNNSELLEHSGIDRKTNLDKLKDFQLERGLIVVGGFINFFIPLTKRYCILPLSVKKVSQDSYSFSKATEYEVQYIVCSYMHTYNKA